MNTPSHITMNHVQTLLIASESDCENIVSTINEQCGSYTVCTIRDGDHYEIRPTTRHISRPLFESLSLAIGKLL